MSEQPTWEFVEQLGDNDPIAYGGHFLFRDTTKQCDPESEILICPDDSEIEETEDDDEIGEWRVYRYSLPKCTYENGVLSNNRFHPNYSAWFADDIESVASFIGMPTKELIELLCGFSITGRAMAYNAIAEYFGHSNFDDYPLVLKKRSEVEERYSNHPYTGTSLVEKRY